MLPFLEWTPQVNSRSLRADASAALAGGIVVLPQGVAFATLAGLPPEYGLYAAMVPAIVAALFGSSLQMVSGPAATTSVVLFTALHTMAEPGSEQYISYAITLTFMVGVLQLGMGLARLGALAEFVSVSVVVGFTTGAAVIIATSQFRDFFGTQLPHGLHLYDAIPAIIQTFEDIHPPAAIVGAATVLTAIVSKRFWPRLPYMLVAIAGGTLTASLLTRFWSDAGGIATIGALPAALPQLSVPDFSYQTIRTLAPTALAVSVFSLTQSVSIARTLSARTGQTLDGNQEFVGQGLANGVGSFFSAFVCSGSFTRSALNFQSGARTPLAAALSAVVLIGLVMLVGPLAGAVPKAALAGLLLVVAWGLVDLAQIRQILVASRGDGAVMGVTFAATLLFALDFAILLGVLLSLALYLRRTSRPTVSVRVPDTRREKRRFTTDASLPECPQLRILRIDGSLFFGAVTYVAQRLKFLEARAPGQKHLWILARSINFVDVAGAELLTRVADERRRRGGALYLSHVKPGASEVLTAGGYIDKIGEQNVFTSKPEAIAGIFERMDHDICARCDKRIFHECQSVPREPRQNGDEP